MGGSKPLFSVLMANYNNARYIQEAINSVLKQSYHNWELVIVDDGSNDNSIEFIKPYLKDKRIRLIKHKKNLGCGAAKRTCASNAKGEILGILDSDDALHKDALKMVVQAYNDNPNCGQVHTNYYDCNANLKILSPCKEILDSAKKIRLRYEKTYHLNTFKKSAYDLTLGFDPKFIIAEDKDLDYKLEEIAELKIINKPLYYYRRHRGGISQGKVPKRYLFYNIIAKYNAYQRRLNTSIPNLTKEEMTQLLLIAGYKSIALLQFNKTKFFLSKALKTILD